MIIYLLTTSYLNVLSINMFLLDYFTQVISTFSISLIVGSVVWLIGAYFTSIGFYITQFSSKFSGMSIIPEITGTLVMILLYTALACAVAFSPIIFPTTSHIWGTIFAFALSVIIIFAASSSRTRGLVSFINMIIHLVTGIYLNSTVSLIFATMFLIELIGFRIDISSDVIAFGIGENHCIWSYGIVNVL